MSRVNYTGRTGDINVMENDGETVGCQIPIWLIIIVLLALGGIGMASGGEDCYYSKGTISMWVCE